MAIIVPLALQLFVLFTTSDAQTTDPADSDRVHIRSTRATRVLEDGELIVYLDDPENDVRITHRTTRIRAPRAKQVGSSGSYRFFFYDDVRVVDGEVHMRGDHGVYFQNGRVAELTDNVVIRDSTGVIRAQRAKYYRDSSILRLWGDVDFDDPETRVLADSVIYDEATGRGEAFGNVVLIDKESNSEARGPHGFYDRRSGETWLDPRPRLVLKGKEGEADTYVDADSIRMQQGGDRVDAVGDVRIERGDIVATAENAYLLQDRNLLQLRKRPVVTQGASQIYGRDIDVFFGEKEVERVIVRRRARLVQSRSDTLLIPDPNQAQGDSAIMYFENGALKRAVISGNASSVFVPDERKKNRLAFNEAVGDSIIMVFKDDEPEEVIFLGNASGTYRFYDGDIEALEQRKEVAVDSTFGVVVGDTTRFDFQKQAEIVRYQAERILYLTAINDLHLQNGAQVDYDQRTLQAGRIVLDGDTDQLKATHRPVLLEGGDKFYGEEMGYDMAKRNAYVTSGATQYDQGYYKGQRILRQPDGTLLVDNGRYTTCSFASPHYSFRSKEMKIYLRDKAIGRPVVLYLGHIPVAYLPFFYNSTDTGRRSGFLQPDIEVGLGSRSRYIRGLDYYWAASDYWDMLFSTEYNERSRVDRSTVSTVLRDTSASRSLQLTSRLRYKLRYNFDGNLQMRYRQDLTSDSRFLTLNGSHNQDVGERMEIDGRLDYASSDRAVQLVNENTNFERALERTLTSTLRVLRRDDLVTTNLSLRRVQTVNADNSLNNRPVLSMTLPSLQLTGRRVRLAPQPRGDGGWFGQKFLSDLQWTPRLNFNHLVDDIRRPIVAGGASEISGEIFPDSLVSVQPQPGTGFTSPGPLQELEPFNERTRRISASSGISLSRPSNLWFLSLTPSVSYGGNYNWNSSAPSSAPEGGRGIFRQSASTSMGLTTRFYGIFSPRMGSLRTIRHTLEPRATLSYIPKIGDDQVEDLRVGLTLRNQIDFKYDRDGETRRYDGLFDWSLSTSYDPDPPPGGELWGNISSSMTLNRQGPLRLTISQTYDPQRGKVTRTSIPFTFRFGGTFPGYGVPMAGPEELNLVAQEEGVTTAPDSLGPENEWGFRDPNSSEYDALDLQAARAGLDEDSLGWNLSFGYSFIRQEGRTQRSNIALNLDVQPTAKWRITYRTTYDSRTGRLTQPRLRVERDLHCWKASFSRVLFGGEWRYYFRIHVNQHQDDLFLESGERGARY